MYGNGILVWGGAGFTSASTNTAYAHNAQWDSSVNYGWSGNLTYAFYEDKLRVGDSLINPLYSQCKGHVVQKSEYAGNMSSGATYLSGAYMINQKVQGTVQFFVTKSSKLYLCMFVYGGGGRHSLANWCACTWANSFNTTGVPKGPACDIAEVSVY